MGKEERGAQIRLTMRVSFFQRTAITTSVSLHMRTYDHRGSKGLQRDFYIVLNRTVEQSWPHLSKHPPVLCLPNGHVSTSGGQGILKTILKLRDLFARGRSSHHVSTMFPESINVDTQYQPGLGNCLYRFWHLGVSQACNPSTIEQGPSSELPLIDLHSRVVLELSSSHLRHNPCPFTQSFQIERKLTLGRQTFLCVDGDFAWPTSLEPRPTSHNSLMRRWIPNHYRHSCPSLMRVHNITAKVLSTYEQPQQHC